MIGENIERFDWVEIIEVPEDQIDSMEIGDIGVVLDKYDDENFEVECVNSDGSYKWLTPLHVRFMKVKSKDPDGIKNKFGK